MFHTIHDTGLASFRQLPRLPETPVSGIVEHEIQHSNSRKAPCTPYRLEMRADSLPSLTEVVSQLSTSFSSAGFPKESVRERDREFAASSGKDTKMPLLERRPDFPAKSSNHANLSSHKMSR